MNIYTFKLTKKTIAIGVAALVLLVGLIVLLVSCGGGDAKDAAGIRGMTSKEDLKGYIEELGYTVSDTVWESREVVIPSKFDKVYTEYNELQKKCGFDLAEYKGKKVSLHTFGITNYEGVSEVLCDLLVYKDKIIGGSIYTADVSGFMHGLTARAAKAPAQ